MSSRSKPADIVPDPLLDGDPRWQLVQRLVVSPQLTKSGRLQELLVYVCRCAIERRPGDLTEQTIGERVFERPSGYNPNEDNIVRAQARLLRQKLQAYFDAEGKSEPLLLTIPKGGYAPEFLERPNGLPATPARARWSIPSVRGLLILAGLLGIAVVVLAWLLVQSKHQRMQSATSTRSPALHALWSQMFGENVTTTVIVPDATEGMLQEASKQPVDLATYLRRSPRPENEKTKLLDNTLRGFSIRRYTTFDGVSTAAKMTQLAAQFGGRVNVRYARDMTLREFSPGNVVLIGRPSTNPWGEMFEAKLNFRFYSDFQQDIAICRNREPRPGEQAEYLPINEGARRTVYAAAAFVPNLNNGGHVLMLFGMSSGAQEGAAEFVTNEKLLGGFANKVWTEQALKPGSRLPHFEILIRMITLAGAAQEPEVIASRILER